MVDVAGNNVPSSISKDGWSAGGGAGGGECGAADEADTLSEAGAGGDKLEGTDSTQDDALHLERRVGLFSGVALIVGTMIGKCSLCKALYLGTYVVRRAFVLGAASQTSTCARPQHRTAFFVIINYLFTFFITI